MIDAGAFERMTGRPPEQDDLHRVNCTTVGTVGHFSCGICPEHNGPRFVCGCFVTLRPVCEPTPD